MPLSVVDLYKDVLPQTNCRECGWATCLAFAGMVVSEQYPLSDCPHIEPRTAARCQLELESQYAAGKWTKRDVARDALQWAKERSANMEITALPERLGGRLIPADNGTALELPYFDDVIVIDENRIGRPDGTELSHWEQVFVYNYMAQGGKRRPTGKWKAFREFPNTVSKIKNMVTDVEVPLVERFQGRLADLEAEVGS